MLELLGKQDVYIEVAEKYKQYILCGIYNAGDRLPSVRTVGAELGVNPNTVAKAYSLLEKEGYIKALPKKGAYVIYEPKNDERKIKIYQAKAVLEDLKKQGISYAELAELIKEVWDEND